MQKWEYLTLETSKAYGTTKYHVNGNNQPTLKNARFAEVINQLGGQGWELVGISTLGSDQTFVFKRPIAVKAPSAAPQREQPTA
jgi:hypothetical protein